jgi:2-dehydropantoate 2-reductase
MGVGGVGGYFGGRLAQAGEEVIFIARGAHLSALQSNGLHVESIQGDFTIRPVQASDDPHQVGLVDMILLGVKAWQVTEVAGALKPMIAPETGVIFLGNGVEAPGQVAAILGEQHAMGGLCQISAAIAAPGHIRHVGIQPYVAFGEMDGRSSSRALRLKQAFERAGVKADIPDDILAAMWEKFVFIASISGVGAVARSPVGVTRRVPETRQMLIQALEEVVLVGQARGVNLPPDLAVKRMAFIDSIAPEVTASMQRDIVEGRPSELEAQNAAVVRMGREARIPTPVHAFIYASLLPQELKARDKL